MLMLGAPAGPLDAAPWWSIRAGITQLIDVMYSSSGGGEGRERERERVRERDTEKESESECVCVRETERVSKSGRKRQGQV